MRVLLRTEGNHQQGMGDAWGSVAIAEACAALGDQVLLLCSGGEAVELIRQSGHACEVVPSAQDEQRAVTRFGPDVIVVNQLQTPAERIQAFKTQARLVVTIDDAGPGAAAADVRINPLYETPNAITAYAYLTLRRDVAEFHARPKPVQASVHELLVTQGGADTHGFLPRIVEAVGGLGIPHCTVVVGPAFRHERELADALDGASMPVSVVRNPRDLARLLWAADLAVTAGGLMMFELACVGTPTITVCAERFEVETAQRLERAGATRCLGFGGEMEPGRLRAAVETLAADRGARERMSDAGRRLVDGQGATRIARLLRQTMAEVAGAGR